MPNAKYKMQEFPTWYTCAPSHFSNFLPRMVSALETDVISRHLPKFPRIFSDPLKKVQNRKFWVCMKWKYKIWNRDIFTSFFSSHFQKSRPSDLGKTTSCSRHKIGVLCKIKDISSLLLLPCSKHLCNIESCLFDCQSQFISPPLFPPMSLFNRIYHIKTIAEFSWRVGTLKRLCLNQLYREFMQKFPCERGPNSGVVLHTPPRDEALSGNKRYLVHSMCEFCFHKTAIQFFSFLCTTTI